MKIDDIIISNERDERSLAWLRREVGDEAISEALSRLAGNRRPYITNLCHELGLVVPDEVKRGPPKPMPPEVRQRLDEIRQKMMRK